MRNSQHVYAVRPRKDKRDADLISDALPFRRLQRPIKFDDVMRVPPASGKKAKRKVWRKKRR